MKKFLVIALSMILGIVAARQLVIVVASRSLSRELVEELESYLESIS